MILRNITQQTIFIPNAVLAKTFFARSRGLLGRKEIASDQALIIAQCPSIHMFFMKFPIDVVFADKKCKVIGLVKNIKPFSLSPFFFHGYYAIELKVGTIAVSGVKIGDVLSFE